MPVFHEGSSFKVNRDPHLWVIISDPIKDADEVLHVNFTSLVPTALMHDPRNDRSCMIRAGEHPFVQHDTCVYYFGARTCSVSHLQWRHGRRELWMEEPVSRELLEKIRRGAAESDHILPAHYDILVAQNLI